MPVYFFDSSALVKRYHDELGTSRVQLLFDQADERVISRLTHLEITSALVRLARSGHPSAADLSKVLNLFDHDVSWRMDVVTLDASIIDRGRQLVRSRGLRAADALQLASALVVFGQWSEEEFVFVSCDRDLNIAAAAEGLQVFDPTTQP